MMSDEVFSPIATTTTTTTTTTTKIISTANITSSLTSLLALC